MSANKLLVFLACLAGLLPACATLPAPAPVAAPQGTVSAYTLGPDDVVRVIVEQHPEWSGEFTVRGDGNIFIPGVGETRIGGMNKEQAAGELTLRLEELIRNPRVTMDIVRYASQMIYVMGAVERPGRYSTEGKTLTLRDAVILAGMPNRIAATRRVFVISPARKRPSKQVVNLERILNRGEMEHNIALTPGDIVYVPKTLLGEISEFISIILAPVTQTIPATRTAIATPFP